MKVNEKKVAIVTGSSSGIGFQTALLWPEMDIPHMHLCEILKNLKPS